MGTVVRLMTAVTMLDWDTQFWGVRSARLHATTAPELAEAEACCAALGVAWGSLLVPMDNLDLLNHAVRRDFQVVDVRHTLRARIEEVGGPTPTIATSADGDAMADIAATAFPRSRFALDEHLNESDCERFYETWARNSLDGQMADTVVISRDPSSGVLDGFMTVRFGADSSADLPLVAIRADRRGKGVGRQLLSDALRCIAAHGRTTVDVVTQLSNTPAIRLYEAAGFRTIDSGVWLHRWF